jgi:hypothetical protein
MERKETHASAKQVVSSNLKRPDVPELSPAKTFVISFHKTGTSSLHAFAKRIGLRARHAPAIENGVDLEKLTSAVLQDKEAVLAILAQVVAKYDFHSDIPWPGLYRELARHYPETKFIYIERDPDQWVRSVAAHWSLALMSRRLRPFEVIQYNGFLPDGKRVIARNDEQMLRDAFVRHRQDVLATISPERMLVLNLQASDAADQLSKFMDLHQASQLHHENRRWSPLLRALRNANSKVRNWRRFGTNY